MVYLTMVDGCLISTERTERTERTDITPHAHVLFALGLYLIIERGKRIPRDMLASLLWPKVPTQSARCCLRRALWKLRRIGFPVSGDNGPDLFLSKHAATTDLDTLTQRETVDLVPKSFEILPWYEPRCSAQFCDWVDDLRDLSKIRITHQLITIAKRAESNADWTTVLHLSDRILTYDDSCEYARDATARAQAHLRSINAVATSFLSPAMLPSTIARFGTTTLSPYATHLAESTRGTEYGQSLRPSLPFRHTVLVGRHSELAFLTHALQQTTHGSGCGIYLWGAAGIGKSRLIAELHTIAKAQGAVVQYVVLQDLDAHQPWSVFTQIVPSLQQAPGAAGCRPELARYLHHLAQNHAPPPPAPPPPHSASDSSTYLYDHTQLALFDLIEAVADEQPVILIVENMHAVDPCSQSVLANMVAWASSHAVLIICTSRTPPPDALARTTRQALTVQYVAPLSPESSSALVDNYLHFHQHAPDTQITQWCISVAEGNPYFLEELLAHWIKTGERFHAPTALTTLIETRIAALSDTARKFLRACAILDKDATYDRVQNVFGSSRQELFSAMEELGTTGLLISDGDAPITGITLLRCRHDLVRDITLHMLSNQGREVLHTHAATVLERELSELHNTPLRWTCADHWQAAGNHSRATQLGIDGIALLTEQGRTDRIIEACERTLSYCSTDQEQLDTLSPYACALHSIRDHDKALSTLTALRHLKTRLAPTATPHDECELLTLDTMSYKDHHWPHIANACRNCLTAGDATSQHKLEAAILLCQLATGMGNAALVHEAHHVITPLLVHADVSEISRSRFEAIYHSLVGNTTISSVVTQRLLAFARETRRGTPLLSSLLYSARCLQWSGQTDAATTIFAEVAATATQEHQYPYAGEAVQQLITMFLNCGDVPTAQIWADQLDSLPLPTNHSWTRQSILLQLRLAIARQHIHTAEEIFKTHGDSLLNDPLLSFQATALAAQVRLACLQNVAPAYIADTIQTLSDVCKTLRGMRMYDYEHFSLYLGLSYMGETDRARGLLQNYLTQFRRDVTPPPPEIQSVVRHERLTCTSL